MNGRLFIYLWALVAFAAGPVRADLATDFANPPEATKPRCYWYWFDDHVSQEGITRDLEAMKRVRIGGAYIGIIGGAIGKRTELNPKPLTTSVLLLPISFWPFFFRLQDIRSLILGRIINIQLIRKPKR